MKVLSMAATILALITLSAPPAFAHGDAPLDKQKGANGGQLRMAGSNIYELVVAKDSNGEQENPVVVYVADHDGVKIVTAGATGTATLLAGKLKVTTVLKPDGDNRMKGLAKYVSSPDMKVVVSITLPSKQPEQARFTP